MRVLSFRANSGGIEKLVVVELRGGLGNQLFQYAAGRAVANERGLPLYCDKSWFRSCGARPYVLDHLQARVEEASPEMIEEFAKKLGNDHLPNLLYG